MARTRSAHNAATDPADPLVILHIVRSPVGGIFRHIRDLALAQSRAGHKVGIVCDARTGGAFEDAQIASLDTKLKLGVTRLPMHRAISPVDLRTIAQVYRICRKVKPDIIHAHGSKGGTYGRLVAGLERLRGRRPRAYYAPHGGSLHYDPHSLAGRLYFRVERALERLTDGLIHVSDYEARTYKAKIGTPRCPVHIVHNGLMTAEFQPLDRPDDTMPAPADFLYIGMLRDLKGVDLFIDALATLQACGIAASALIVGEGSPADERRYRAQVDNLGLADAVTFRPPLPARQAFAMARTIIVPSRAESLPYIVLEAGAAGMPMIATNVGGIPEIVGRQADRLIAPGDVAALQGAMMRAITDPGTMAARAEALRDSLKKKFSVTTMTRRIETIYRAEPATTGKTAPKPDFATLSRT
ncbi:MAG: glycosyltransferase family 4 protein [Alphaproteobacteria bacterium]